MAGVRTTRGDAYEYLAGKMGRENTKEKQSSATSTPGIETRD